MVNTNAGSIALRRNGALSVSSRLWNTESGCFSEPGRLDESIGATGPYMSPTMGLEMWRYPPNRNRPVRDSDYTGG